MGPSGRFYSCTCLMIWDTDIPQVDGWSTRHPGIWGVTLGLGMREGVSEGSRSGKG